MEDLRIVDDWFWWRLEGYPDDFCWSTIFNELRKLLFLAADVF